MRLGFIAALLVGCGSSDGLTVTIDSGTLHGGKTGDVRHFLGIPYAAPPLGELRWRAPQPAIAWTGTLQALQTSDQCPQSLSYNGPSNNEDCLYLNVWTPAGAHDLPVMVWLHGGAFIFGSGGDKYYSGEHLADRGVVVVTLNYRLGPFGFMALPQLDTDDPAYPTSGNYGLADQRAALEWVQRNIAAFGGDPAKVTLFGESAGGFSTCVHYFSTKTAHLFGSAIAESGLCGAPVLENTHAVALQQGTDLATALGCTSGDVLACMRGQSAQALLDATALPMPATQMPGGPFYQPSLLPNALPNVDGVIYEQALSAGPPSALPPRTLVLGTNKDEGTLFHAPIYAKAVADETEYRAALAVRFPGKVDAIVAQYPVASYPSANDALAAVSGDAFFVCPTRRTIKAAASHGAFTFRYSYEHPLANPFFAGLGVFHSSEIPFVFGNDNYPLGSIGGDTALVETIQSLWTGFAHGSSVGWTAGAWTPTDNYELFDDSGASAKQGLKTALCDFWDAQ